MARFAGSLLANGEFSNPAPLDKHAFKKINKYLNEGSFFKKLYVIINE